MFYHSASSLNQNLTKTIKEIQYTIKKDMNLSITCIIGDKYGSSNGILDQLDAINNQRFYLKYGSITELTELAFSTDNLYSYFIDTLEELRIKIIEADDQG
ncbi:hypothetical protein CV093_17520 [Oceanobacillus sp. 143]|nr:hypothetical protein CV093_17520 [Oceanobacillus sp. 143]